MYAIWRRYDNNTLNDSVHKLNTKFSNVRLSKMQFKSHGPLEFWTSNHTIPQKLHSTTIKSPFQLNISQENMINLSVKWDIRWHSFYCYKMS